MEAQCGGVVNVASFLLRVLLLLSAWPPLARLLVLDESFNNVSDEYLPRCPPLFARFSVSFGVSPDGIVYYSNETEIRRLVPVEPKP